MGLVALPGTAPNPVLVATLRALLERAEAGELREVAVATVNLERCVGTTFVIDDEPDYIRMLGAVAILHARVLHRIE
jgi:hypothetical protein